MTTTPTHPTFAATAHLPECDLPCIHLNGTGGDTLLREYLNAHRELNIFVGALVKTTCHGRDYYPLGDEAHQDALRTRRAIYSLCDEIDAYLCDHIKHLSGVRDTTPSR